MTSKKQIALERIKILFKQAKQVFKKNPDLSNRYITLARKLSMKAKVRIPRDLQKKFCKHCYKYLVPGTNCRVRIVNRKLVYYCLNCKKYMRFPIK